MSIWALAEIPSRLENLRKLDEAGAVDPDFEKVVVRLGAPAIGKQNLLAAIMDLRIADASLWIIQVSGPGGDSLKRTLHRGQVLLAHHVKGLTRVLAAIGENAN